MDKKTLLQPPQPVAATTENLRLAYLVRRSRLRPALAKLVAELAFDTRRAA